jgi:hypothetical protein
LIRTNFSFVLIPIALCLKKLDYGSFYTSDEAYVLIALSLRAALPASPTGDGAEIDRLSRQE